MSVTQDLMSDSLFNQVDLFAGQALKIKRQDKGILIFTIIINTYVISADAFSRLIIEKTGFSDYGFCPKTDTCFLLEVRFSAVPPKPECTIPSSSRDACAKPPSRNIP